MEKETLKGMVPPYRQLTTEIAKEIQNLRKTLVKGDLKALHFRINAKNVVKRIKIEAKEIQDPGIVFQFLRKIPEYFPQIVSLALYLDQLKEFPEELCSLKHLTKLVVRCRDLTHIPSKLFHQMPQLNHLTLGNAISELEKDQFAHNPQLEELVLTVKNLESFPPSLQNLKKIRLLILEGNFVKELLPEFIGEMENIKDITIKNSNLKTLPNS